MKLVCLALAALFFSLLSPTSSEANIIELEAFYYMNNDKTEGAWRFEPEGWAHFYNTDESVNTFRYKLGEDVIYIYSWDDDNMETVTETLTVMNPHYIVDSNEQVFIIE